MNGHPRLATCPGDAAIVNGLGDHEFCGTEAEVEAEWETRRAWRWWLLRPNARPAALDQPTEDA